MKLSIFSKLKSVKSRVLSVSGLLFVQLWLTVLSVQSSPFSPSTISVRCWNDEFQGLPSHSSGTLTTARVVLAFPASNKVSVSTERTVRQVWIDIDRDGDADLVAVTNHLRLVVWLNDGKGHFTSCRSSSALKCSQIVEDPDLNSEDIPLLFLWLQARTFSLDLVPLVSILTDSESLLASLDRLAQSSPRAPPAHLS